MKENTKQFLFETIDLITSNNLTDKHICVSNYPELEKGITDDKLIIEEVYSKEELEEISNNFNPYLKDYGIEPIIGIVGGQTTICIGVQEGNLGRIYCHDFDFGLFLLNETIEEFLNAIS